jgi:hypothetical protein
MNRPSPDIQAISFGKPPYVVGSEKFSSFTPEELNKPEVKERFVKAVIIEMNSGSVDSLFATGDKGGDRWLNDRVWNAAAGVVVGMGIFQVPCLGVNNPFMSLRVVGAMQFSNQLISADACCKFRKELIGQ